MIWYREYFDLTYHIQRYLVLNCVEGMVGKYLNIQVIHMIRVLILGFVILKGTWHIIVLEGKGIGYFPSKCQIKK